MNYNWLQFQITFFYLNYFKCNIFLNFPHHYFSLQSHDLSEITLICWFKSSLSISVLKTLVLLHIFVETPILWWIESSRAAFICNGILCYLINLLRVTFDQFNVLVEQKYEFLHAVWCNKVKNSEWCSWVKVAKHTLE